MTIPKIRLSKYKSKSKIRKSLKFSRKTRKQKQNGGVQPIQQNQLSLQQLAITYGNKSLTLIPIQLSKQETQTIPNISVKASGKTLLIMYDPDAPNGMNATNTSKNRTFLHMATIYNDGKQSKELVPYMGPSPPMGTHRYIFTLYQLPQTIQLNTGTAGFEYYNKISPIFKKLKQIGSQLYFTVKA